jgi:hypothetical protein
MKIAFKMLHTFNLKFICLTAEQLTVSIFHLQMSSKLWVGRKNKENKSVYFKPVFLKQWPMDWH